MANHIGDMLRTGSTNFTATETNLTSLRINGTPRDGLWLTPNWTGVTGGTNAVNTLHAVTSPTGGTYTLTLGGQTTAPINFNDPPATVQARLGALTNVVLNNILYPGPIGTGAFAVSGAATGYAAGDVGITFQGALANQPVALTINTAGLTGGATFSVVATTTGVGPTCAITLQESDDNATWVTPPDWGTIYLPPGLNQLVRPFTFNTPRKYISATLTFGGTGVFTKLQLPVTNFIEGYN